MKKLLLIPLAAIMLILPGCAKPVIEGKPSEIIAEMHNHLNENVTIRVTDAYWYMVLPHDNDAGMNIVLTDSEEVTKPQIVCEFNSEVEATDIIEGTIYSNETLLRSIEEFDGSLRLDNCKFVKE